MTEVKNVITDEQVKSTVDRVSELQKARTEINNLKEELLEHQKDLANAEKVFGIGSNEYVLQKGHVDGTQERLDEVEKKVAELSFKQSELKPVLDELTRRFEEAYKNDTVKEYHIEMAPKPEKEDEPIDGSKGKKVFKQLLEYLLTVQKPQLFYYSATSGATSSWVVKTSSSFGRSSSLRLNSSSTLLRSVPN